MPVTSGNTEKWHYLEHQIHILHTVGTQMLPDFPWPNLPARGHGEGRALQISWGRTMYGGYDEISFVQLHKEKTRSPGEGPSTWTLKRKKHAWWLQRKFFKCELLWVQYKPCQLWDSSCCFIAFNFPLAVQCLGKVSGLQERNWGRNCCSCVCQHCE